MEIEETKYLSYAEAVFIHIQLMRLWGEMRFGVFDRALIESALTRPQQSAAYESSDIIRQAATLCYGLIRNHPWVGGNKRTATAIVDEFLYRNGQNIAASTAEIIQLVLAVESDLWKVNEIESWLRQHSTPL